MRTKLFAWTGIVAGALILLSGGLKLSSGEISTSPGVVSQLGLFLLGASLVLAGLRALRRKAPVRKP